MPMDRKRARFSLQMALSGKGAGLEFESPLCKGQRGKTMDRLGQAGPANNNHF